jgi:hypothetical protein
VIVAIVAAGILGGIAAGITVLVAPGIVTAIKVEWSRRSAEAEDAEEAERLYPHLGAGAEAVATDPGAGEWDAYPVETPWRGREDIPPGTKVTVVADEEKDSFGAGVRVVVVRIAGRKGQWLVSRRALGRPK